MGGKGDDQLWADEQQHSFGEEGDDLLKGGISDLLDGGSGDDQLFGSD